jgi:hypothetical protein
VCVAALEPSKVGLIEVNDRISGEDARHGNAQVRLRKKDGRQLNREVPCVRLASNKRVSTTQPRVAREDPADERSRVGGRLCVIREGAVVLRARKREACANAGRSRYGTVLAPAGVVVGTL